MIRRYGSMGARKARVSVESSICIYGLNGTHVHFRLAIGTQYHVHPGSRCVCVLFVKPAYLPVLAEEHFKK
jgi:hypothetical protein